MRVRPKCELPREKREQLARAIRLEWITIGALITITIVMYLAMGSSQAMKTAWIEDILSLIPPIAFLVATRFRNREPNERFPYGYRRVVIIAFLVAATALTVFGLWLIYESAMALFRTQHPSIGLRELFGYQIWSGWIMIAALIYSATPPVILGRTKRKLARELHEKTLLTDADMNQADWSTALAAIVGILGVGMGWWWADATAAGLIALSITKDGLSALSDAFSDLMDRRPTRVDSDEAHPVIEEIAGRVRALEWVQEAQVHLREEGHIFAGEIFVVPHEDVDIIDRVEEARQTALKTNWQMYDIVVTPVRSLEEA